MVQQGRILMAEPSIYDQLAKESFSDLTITQLNAGTSVTAVDQATISYWKGPLTLSRVLEASRKHRGRMQGEFYQFLRLVESKQ